MRLQSLEDIEAALSVRPALTSRDLHTAWERRQPVPVPDKGKDAAEFTRQIPWLQKNFTLAAEFVACALEKEEFLLVCDCASEALRHWPAEKLDDAGRLQRVRMRMHHATAQARLGYTDRARKQLEPCVGENFPTPLDPGLRAEILVQLGNILREEAICQPLLAARNHIAGEALGFYLRAMAADPGLLEALALSAAVGFIINQPGSAGHARAQEQARRVLAEATGARYDLTYFRAVALAVLGREDEAALTFGELSALPGATTSHLANARYWARPLAETLGKPADFSIPLFRRFNSSFSLAGCRICLARRRASRRQPSTRCAEFCAPNLPPPEPSWAWSAQPPARTCSSSRPCSRGAAPCT